MGRKYYYFVASLPLIDFNGRMPMSEEDFLSDAKRFLDENDFALLNDLMTKEEAEVTTANSFAGKWIEFNRICCNEMACFRAEKVNKSPTEFLKGERIKDLAIIDLLNKADQARNPLEAEKLLDRAKWQYLDEESLDHFFDFEVLLAYGIKLKILSRYNLYQSDEGAKIFDEFKSLSIEKIQEQPV